MFAISFFVGSRFGTWLTGRERFPSEAEAKAEIQDAERCERRADATRFTRRVVRVI